ncbi:MAG TPA: YSC84-related protein [Rubrivivax sp.]
MMERRTVMMAAAAAATGLSLMSGCTTNQSTGDTAAQKKAEINTAADASLALLYSSTPGSRELASKSLGILVFPKIYAAGLGIGGEYGEGALRVGGTSVDYYRTSSVTFGWQAGAQSKALIMMFMTQEALDKFRNSKGWTAGADASVAVMRTGAQGTIDLASATAPVSAFALTNAGLMAGVTVDGTKVTKLDF